MDLSTIISIIAVIISPVLATLIAIWVGEEIRKKNYQKEREDKILEKLIANRYLLSSTEFIGSLNSINFVFSRNEKIKELVKNLHRAYINREDINIANQRLVELIYEICKYKKYNVTEYEIQNLFIPVQTQPVTQNIPQNPSSTSGNSNDSEQSITTSISSKSITGNYLNCGGIREIENTMSLGVPGWINYTRKIKKIIKK